MISLILLSLTTTAFARAPSKFIIGGQNADQGEWPWQLGLYRGLVAQSFSCGASLIAANTAVCAAHCVEGQTATNLLVKAGSISRTCTGNPCDESALISFTMHEDYTGIGITGYRNDVSVLVLETPIQEDPGRVGYVPLASGGDYLGATCYITGWGLTSGGGSLATTLQEAQIDILSTVECENYWGNAQITDNQVCVFDKTTQARGACNGDSGGPLVCDAGGSWELVGATSWGANGCSTSQPSVYTRITAYSDWIIANSP